MMKLKTLSVLNANLSELPDKDLNYKVIDIDGKELKIYIY